MSNHTKGEWKISGTHSSLQRLHIAANGGNVAAVFTSFAGEAQANAERIVKCVNGYDELVEALDSCFALLKHYEIYFLNQPEKEGETFCTDAAYILGKKAHDINLLTHKAKHQ